MNQKIALPALLACCALATCTDEPTVILTPVEEWITQPHYEIGDQMEGDALFARISSVVPTPDGSRVYVLDRQAFEVTIWTPDGTLIGRVGRAGDGPGDFASPGSLFLFDDGFQVAEGLQITTFSLDGDLVRADGLERAMNPAGDASFGRLYHAIAMFDDRSVGAVSSAALVWSGSVTEEMSEVAHPVVRITQDDGSFGVDTLGLLDYRDVWLVLGSTGSFAVRQPFVAPDEFAIDPWNGSAVFSRSPGTSPGLLELIEVSIAGDTVWSRRIHLPPIPVTEDEIQAATDEFAPFLADGTPEQKRDAVRDRMIIIPEYWPATQAIGLRSNGEIWFRPAGEDDPRIWYAVRKREDEGPIRRIVVSESFRPLDANATHVWGVRTDEMGVEYVAGLRLVRAS